LSFGNKNLETKIKILFWIKKIELKIIHFRKENPEERLLCSRNENPKTKIKSPFWIRKSIIQKICSRKRNPKHIFQKGSSEGIFICTSFF